MATRRKKPAAGDAGPADVGAALAVAPLGQPADAARDPDSPNVPVGAAAPAGDAPDPNDPGTYNQALRELGINVPVAVCRLVGTRLEFRLYGGRVLYWPPEPPAAAGETQGGKK